jgi:hypothetical protein
MQATLFKIRNSKLIMWLFLLKGPAADATDASQPWRIIVQPCDEDDEVFHFNGALVEWNSKYSDKNLSQCHFVHHKSHMDWTGIESGPPRWEAGD